MTERVIALVDAGRRKPIPPAVGPAAGPARDRLSRPLRDLRISVTDRCNFRCTYCMPREAFGEDYRFLAHEQLLSFEEIARLAKLFVDQGIEKIRLTGGEPLLRRNIERLIEMLAQIPGIELTLTTNASLLERKARALKDAGLTRVSVSLDALDDPTFMAMNDADFPVAKVLAGIDAADAAGLAPVKINMVVKRGVNEHSILPMARYFRRGRHVLRFIEFMDVGATNGWRMDDVIPSTEIVRMINAEMALEPIDPNYPGEVAQRWRYRDGSGEIGVISSVTQAFCRSCTRARISTEGMLYTCLFATSAYDFRALLREGKSDAAIRAAMAAVWGARDDRYSEIRTEATVRESKIEMSYIGG
ncbi:MAG: GTP 3',8-cyclase MoaA [Pseudomonadota bacterium]